MLSNDPTVRSDIHLNLRRKLEEVIHTHVGVQGNISSPEVLAFCANDSLHGVDLLMKTWLVHT